MESFEKHDLDLTKMLNLLQKLRNNVFEITLYNKYWDKMLSISPYLASLHTIKNIQSGQAISEMLHFHRVAIKVSFFKITRQCYNTIIFEFNHTKSFPV